MLRAICISQGPAASPAWPMRLWWSPSHPGEAGKNQSAGSSPSWWYSTWHSFLILSHHSCSHKGVFGGRAGENGSTTYWNMTCEMRSLGTFIASSPESLQSSFAFPIPISSSNCSEPTRTKLGASVWLCWTGACILHPNYCFLLPPPPPFWTPTQQNIWASPCLSLITLCTVFSAGSEVSSSYADLFVHSPSTGVTCSEIHTVKLALMLGIN